MQRKKFFILYSRHYIYTRHMYTLTRSEAAESLDISTRSIDRYIRSWKLRSKKDGKIIYIHKQDVDNLSWEAQTKTPEVILPKNTSWYSYSQSKKEQNLDISETNVNREWETQRALEKIYIDLRHEIEKKDKTIQDLAIRLGQAQEIAKNSVSIIEFKKSQYLLEESKNHITQEADELRNEAQKLQEKLSYEKTSNLILIIVCILLLLGLAFVWYLQI